MDKCTEIISLRVTPLLKDEHDRLSEEDKKHLKRKLLEVVGRFCWSRNHYDPSYYFGEGEQDR